MLPSIRIRPVTSGRLLPNGITVKKSVFPCCYYIVRNHSSSLFLEQKYKISDIIVQYYAWITATFLGELVSYSDI